MKTHEIGPKKSIEMSHAAKKLMNTELNNEEERVDSGTKRDDKTQIGLGTATHPVDQYFVNFSVKLNVYGNYLVSM